MPNQTPADSESFVEFIEKLEDGVLAADLGDTLRDLVAALHSHARDAGGKPQAKLTVSIGFKLDGGIVEVAAAVNTVLPKPIRGRSLFYRTPDNRLSTNNPKQLELGVEIRDVPAPAASSVRIAR